MSPHRIGQEVDDKEDFRKSSKQGEARGFLGSPIQP